jgi:creatinine amidohydrolase
MSKFKAILVSALLVAPALLALADGKTTALIMNGGIEQRGPQSVNGAHSLIVHALGVEIAEKPGNAIVAPVIPFSPNRATPALPGTIGISTAVFAQLDDVAKKLSEKYAGKGIRVVHCNEFYDKVGADFDKWLADNGYPAGSHASVKDTSELLYLGGGKGWVRKDLIATAVGDPVLKKGEARDPKAVRVNNGIEGDARRSTPEIGKKVSDMKVDYAVDQIHRLLQ